VIPVEVGAFLAGGDTRNDRREWLQSGRSAAAYDERLRRYRRQLLPRVVLLALLFLFSRLGPFPEQVSSWLPMVMVLVLALWGVCDLWNDRVRITQERNWRMKALWHAGLLLVLFGLTALVMPFLLSLP
jgi:hypothetical protein